MTPRIRLTALLAALALTLAISPVAAAGEEEAPSPSPQAEPEPNGGSSPSQLGEADEGETAELPETTVFGERTGEGDYLPDRANTATKTNAPILEVPASIQVVPEQVIEDQAALGLEEVYTNVSGATQAGNTLNAQSEVRPFIRGFESQILLRNGMRATSTGAVDLINIESVEVLKGPSSILYGRIEPGGILNFNTKKPLPEPFYEVNQQFGNYDHYRTTFDTTGPLNGEGTVLYRINGAYTNSGSFRDHVDLERYAVAPSLTFLPTDQTEITLDFSYSREQVPYDTGVPFGDDNEPLVSPDTFFGDPDLAGRDLQDIFASYQLDHELNDVWTLRNQFQFHRVHARNEGLRNRGVTGSPGSEMLERRYQNQDRVDNEYQLVTDLLGTFSTGAIDHELLIGLDLVYNEFDNDRFRQSADPIEIRNNPDTDFTPPANNSPQPAWSGGSEWAAIYAQDQLTLLPEDRLHVLFGGRFDYVESEFADEKNHDSAFTGRIGALYDLTDWVSPYVSVSQSFQPQRAGVATASGDPIDPEEGIQYEGGFKFHFFEDRLVSTLAFYQIDKENVAAFDFDHFNDTGEVAYLPGVEQRSRGIELDIAGQVTDQLRVISNYAYTDTEVTANPANPSEVGARFGNVPLHIARTWLAYNFADGTALEGLGFGAGLRYESSHRAQFDDTMLDSYVVADAGVWYRKTLRSGNRIKLQLNVKNLFDKEYYTRASDQSIVHPGAPLTVLGSIGVDF